MNDKGYGDLAIHHHASEQNTEQNTECACYQKGLAEGTKKERERCLKIVNHTRFAQSTVSALMKVRLEIEDPFLVMFPAAAEPAVGDGDGYDEDDFIAHSVVGGSK